MAPAQSPPRAGGSSLHRLVAVTAEGVASGAPYMVGSKLLQGWLTATPSAATATRRWMGEPGAGGAPFGCGGVGSWARIAAIRLRQR
jgi:hypothetical protein